MMQMQLPDLSTPKYPLAPVLPRNFPPFIIFLHTLSLHSQTIDYLKMDIEGSEILAFAQLASEQYRLSFVKQVRWLRLINMQGLLKV